MPLDRMPGDRCAGAVELRCAMTGFSQEHDPATGKAVEQSPEGGVLKIGQKLGRFGNHFWHAAPARLSGNVVARRLPAVLGPALLSNQWHEHDAAEILFLE